MHTHLVVETPIRDSPRTAQIRGMFDLPAAATSRLEWDVHLPLDERPWALGLIVGPSGCGKSTIARALWPAATARSAALTWPPDAALLDGFPPELSIKEVTALLCAVGFSSPPAWLRPFAVLSTGQQFRVTLARLLAEAAEKEALTAGEKADPRNGSVNHSGLLSSMGPQPEGCDWGLTVCDEFTSTVDRTVAKIGSAAVARAVRARKLRFVGVTCHEDVEEWLQPDWVYRPAENLFTWRCLQRRPALDLTVFRCQASAWPLFKPHHYLADALNPSAVCFLATWEEQPVAFSAWLPFVGAGPPARREHRTVTLPDFQGVGIGNRLSDYCASLWAGLGYRALSTTTHPALIQARLRSPHWRLTRPPSFAARHEGRLKHALTRLTAGFRYVGPALPAATAAALLGS